MDSIDRIPTTHVGSLPRSEMVADVVLAVEQGTSVSDELYDAVLGEAIDVEVERQKRIGIDVVSDGEFSKISYASYAQHRLTGFSATAPLSPLPTWTNSRALQSIRGYVEPRP